MAQTPLDTDLHVGRRVRMRRMMLGMSQGKMADAIGLSFQQVQKYEKGSNRISASKLQQIAEILQVPVAFFFDGAGPNVGEKGEDVHVAPSPTYVDEFLANADSLALVKAFTGVPDAPSRRRIVALAEALAERFTASADASARSQVRRRSITAR